MYNCINTDSTLKTVTKRAKGGEELIVIDYTDRRPLYEQIVDRFQELIVKEILEEGEQLPSVRSLAMELSINPNTIQRAYAELERRGIIYCVKGKGNFVSEKNNVRERKRQELFDTLDSLAETAKQLGVTREELVEHIKEKF